MLKRLYYKFFLYPTYDRAAIDAEEEGKFKSIGASSNEALSRLNAILGRIRGKDFDFKTDSIHWLLWSAVRGKKEARRILEIGTSLGEGTRILAELFPEAEIVSVDLPESDPLLRAFYKREDDAGYKKYLEEQAKNTHYPNIHLLKTNSFFLTSQVEKGFDLIWVDGGHLLPDVAWDLANAWNLAAPGGIVMCDDVIPEPGHKNAYASSESAGILRYLSERTGAEPTLFLKRRSPQAYWPTLKRKYVSYIVKPD